MGVKCFYLEPTDLDAIYLRRYSHEDGQCAGRMSYHNAKARVEDRPDGDEIAVTEYADDPRWPTACSCGYVFTEADVRQVFRDSIYRRSDTADLIPLRDAPPGAMWDATWMRDIWHGDDGRCLVVKLPNGNDWVIDSQCSNCTMPEDRGQKQHHCWIRHGEPPNITVDKNGVTCGAGAGSIQSGSYHGFLVNGEFQP